MPDFARLFCFIAVLFGILVTASPIPDDTTVEVPSQAYIDRLRSEGKTEQEIASHLFTTQLSTQRHPTPAFPLAADTSISTSPTTSTSSNSDPSSLLATTSRRIAHLLRFDRRRAARPTKRDTTGDVSPSALTPTEPVPIAVAMQLQPRAPTLRERIEGFMVEVMSGRVRVRKEMIGRKGEGREGGSGVGEREVAADGMGGTVLRPRGGRQWFA
ncbi:MAG: hypothetical protein M1822_007763 [Bathelium mastoideum]|nr:MAG: hypothetical protein M1822_007763 [Bathelium mastoideum]